MPFKRIVGLHVDGDTLGGRSLDSLYSKEIDRNGLKGWAYTFSKALRFNSSWEPDLDEESRLTFAEAFFLDLYEYCLQIASFDGTPMDEEIAAANWLADKNMSRSEALEALNTFRGSPWASGFPLTFEMLVKGYGSGEGGIETAAVVAQFYYQVARYMYDAVEHEDPFKKGTPAYDHARAFFKYVERAGAIDFRIPKEYTVWETLEEWERLNKLDIADKRRRVCGEWRFDRGNNPRSEVFSSLVIDSDGTGCALKKRLVRTQQYPLIWKVEEVSEMNVPVLVVPSLGLSIICVLLEEPDNRMAGTIVTAGGSRSNIAMVIYERV